MKSQIISHKALMHVTVNSILNRNTIVFNFIIAIWFIVIIVKPCYRF